MAPWMRPWAAYGFALRVSYLFSTLYDCARCLAVQLPRQRYHLDVAETETAQIATFSRLGLDYTAGNRQAQHSDGRPLAWGRRRGRGAPAAPRVHCVVVCGSPYCRASSDGCRTVISVGMRCSTSVRVASSRTSSTTPGTVKSRFASSSSLTRLMRAFVSTISWSTGMAAADCAPTATRLLHALPLRFLRVVPNRRGPGSFVNG